MNSEGKDDEITRAPVNLRWYEDHLFMSVSVAIFCFGITYAFWGFYYVDYEGTFDAFYSGALTPGVRFGSIYFLAHIGLSQAYSWLYTWWPDVEWLSWILYTYLFLSATLGLYLSSMLLPQRLSPVLRVLVLVAVYWFIFADHTIHFIFTRVSYLLAGLSLISLVVLFPVASVIRSRWPLFLLLQATLTLGILTRLESGTAAISMLIVWGWFMLQDIRQWLRLFVYPLMLIGVLVAGISHEIRTATAFYLQIEPDIEVQYGERQNMVSLSDMHTYRDSVLYQAAGNMMWSDPAVLTPTYLRSLIRKEAPLYTDARQWARTYSDIVNVVSHYKLQLSIWLLLVLCIFLQYKSTRRWSLYYLLAFELSFWGLNVMQTYTAKINDRSFAPFLSLFLLCHIVILLRYMQEGIKRRVLAILVCCGVLCIAHVIYLKAEADTLRADWQIYRANATKIASVTQGKILAVNSNSLDYLCLANTPFHKFDFSAFGKVCITDGSMIPFLPYYKAYIEKECSCSVYHFPDVWTWLAGQREDVIILSEPGRMDIVTNYMKEVYDFTLPLQEVKGVNLMPEHKSENRQHGEQIYIFSLQKKTQSSQQKP